MGRAPDRCTGWLLLVFFFGPSFSSIGLDWRVWFSDGRSVVPPLTPSFISRGTRHSILFTRHFHSSRVGYREASADLGKALAQRPNDVMLRKESAVLKVCAVDVTGCA